MSQKNLDIQVVIGPESRETFKSVVAPSLQSAFTGDLSVHLLDYSGEVIHSEWDSQGNVSFIDHSSKEIKGEGFGFNHNVLFQLRNSNDPFIILNPDALPAPSSIDVLLNRYLNQKGKVAIVEGTQWPFAHPKEFDQVTLETPWASAAFCLVDGDFFRQIEGFDERYFMYLEDVDLSWNAWASGWKVLHEPKAGCFHFSDGPFYRDDLESLEERMGKRNFVLLLEKFFGKEGLRHAFDTLCREFGVEKSIEIFSQVGLYDVYLDDGDVSRSHGKSSILRHKRSQKIKVLGYNQFHRLRGVDEREASV